MKNALLVIDVQIGLATGAYNETEVIEAINKTASWVHIDRIGGSLDVPETNAIR